MTRSSDTRRRAMVDYTVPSNKCVLRVYARGIEDCDTTIVFLHGGPGSGAQAIMELSAFQRLEQRYRCIYFDQRGCGNSLYNIKCGIDQEEIIQDVHLVIDDVTSRFSQERIILWGGSFGGLLGCLYMERYPDEVDGLILSNPALTYSREQSLAMFQYMKQSIKAQIEDPLGQIAYFLKEENPERMFEHPLVRDLIFSKQNPSNSLRHITAMSAWFFQKNFTNTFTQISCPTLILLGKDDNVIPAHITMDVLKENENPLIEMRCIAACGHSIFIDQEEAFVSSIIDFITSYTKSYCIELEKQVS